MMKFLRMNLVFFILTLFVLSSCKEKTIGPGGDLPKENGTGGNPSGHLTHFSDIQLSITQCGPPGVIFNINNAGPTVTCDYTMTNSATTTQIRGSISVPTFPPATELNGDGTVTCSPGNIIITTVLCYLNTQITMENSACTCT